MTRFQHGSTLIAAAALLVSTPVGYGNLVVHSTMDNVDISAGGSGDTSIAPFTVFDNAGSAENGAATGSPNAVTSGVPGILGEAVDFEGAGSFNRQIDYGNVHNHAGTGYTASVWFNPDNVAAATQMIAHKGNAASGDDGWSIWTDATGILHLRGNHGVDGDFRVAVETPSGTITNNTWYHATLVLDDANNVLVGYLDGLGSGTTGLAAPPGQSLDNGFLSGGGGGATNAYSPGDLFDTTNPIELGVRNNDLTFDGQVDDFALWTRALSAAEVGALRNLALEPALQYDAAQVDQLLTAFNASDPIVTVDGIEWRLVDDGSLGGSPGQVTSTLVSGFPAFAINLGGGNGLQTVPVPEPSGLFLLGAAACGLSRRLRRRRHRRAP